MTSDVLIPRPETEVLVENGLDWLKNRAGGNFIADIGTGSGCIAVSIACNLPENRVIGTDISSSALRVAQENINIHSLNNQIYLVQANLMKGLNFQFDCICANLPYIPSEILPTLAVSKYEPAVALDGGHDGLKSFKLLLNQSRSRIKSDGLILLEIEASQASQLLSLANANFPSASVRILPDLAGLPRLVLIKLNGG